MPEFPERKLQVFVSSTFVDLQTERQAAVEAILGAGHIPAGMELFAAGDKSQMEVIRQWIDESDVYMLILGGRYGSIEEVSGRSYTHIEYEYALSRSKPVFACVIDSGELERRMSNHQDGIPEETNLRQLDEFRSLVTSKVVKFWTDPKDIRIAIGESLSEFERRSELPGWVRSDEAPGRNGTVKYDIGGLWEYVCKGFDKQLEHGGHCTIRLEESPVGVRWALDGSRCWMKELADGEEPQRKTVDPPFPWTTKSGAYVDESELLWSYTVSLGEETINGFGEGRISKFEDDTPVEITGHYYQVPPVDPLHGEVKFRRMASETDYAWFDAE